MVRADADCDCTGAASQILCTACLYTLASYSPAVCKASPVGLALHACCSDITEASCLSCLIGAAVVGRKWEAVSQLKWQLSASQHCHGCTNYTRMGRPSNVIL